MFSPPAVETPFDLRFDLFGTQVQVHPLFWLIALTYELSLWDSFSIVDTLIWLVILVPSLLIHEMGHIFIMRYFHHHGRILLYGGGGRSLPASPDHELTRQQNILVSSAGPLISIVLAALIMLTVALFGGSVWVTTMAEFIPTPFVYLPQLPAKLGLAIQLSILINLFWGIINLLPSYPLDGGQLFLGRLSTTAPRRAFIISVATNLILLLIGWIFVDSLFLAIFFGYLAYLNIQAFFGERSITSF